MSFDNQREFILSVTKN